MAEAQASAAKQVPALGVVRLAGRIQASRRKTGANGSFFVTVLRLPATDAYSSPATVEVLSDERVGGVGDEVSIACKIGGYSRTVKPRDPQEPSYLSADNVLSVIAHA